MKISDLVVGNVYFDAGRPTILHTLIGVTKGGKACFSLSNKTTGREYDTPLMLTELGLHNLKAKNSAPELNAIEGWINIFSHAEPAKFYRLYLTKEDALASAKDARLIKTVHMVAKEESDI